MATATTGQRTAGRRPDRIVSRRALGLLSVSHLVDDLYQGAVPAILPFLILDRGYGYTAATGITLAATVLSSVVQPIFGVLADRRPLPWLTPAGLLVAGIGVGLSGLVDAYAWTWAAIALSGLGVAAFHPAAARATRAAAGASAQGMSWFALGGNLGLAAGPAVAAPLLLAYGLLGTPLLAIPAIIMAIVLVGLRRWISPPVPTKVPIQARTTMVPARTTMVPIEARTTMVPARTTRPAARSPEGVDRSGPATPDRPTGAPGMADDWRSFGWLSLLVALRSIAYFGVSSLLALYVIRRFNSSAAVGSAVLTTFLTVGAGAGVAGGWIADRWTRLTAIRTGYALSIPALVLLLSAPSTALAAIAAALTGIGIYLPFSVQTTLGQEYLPNRIGTASGVTLGLAVSAGGAFAPVLGWIADTRGLGWALGGLLALPAIALLVTLRLSPPARR